MADSKSIKPEDSSADKLILHQQVILTGTERDIGFLLGWLQLQRFWHRVTVSITDTSVPASNGSVTAGVPQKSHEEEA